MNCDETKILKHAYVDRELDIVRAAEIERHLRDCPACSRSYENVRALSSALKSSNLYSPAPAGLKGRIRASITPEHKEASMPRPSDSSRLASAPLWQHWLKWIMPLAGTALVALLLITLLAGPSAQSRLAQEVTASHVRSLMANHLTDVASSDQHTVKPWFSGKLDFAPPVKDLAAQGFPLIGGRLDYLQDRSVAALVYRRSNHFINLFIWPSKQNSTTNVKHSDRQGYNLVQWSDAGMTYWAVSDLNAGELSEFAEIIRK